MAQWNRGEQIAFLRALDAAVGILVTPAGREPAGRLVVEWLVAATFQQLGGEDPEQEAERAGRWLARLAPEDVLHETAVRAWLRGVVRERAQEINERLWEGERGWIDLREVEA